MKHHILPEPQDRKADVVGQRNVDAVIEPLAQDLAGIGDDSVCDLDMFKRHGGKKLLETVGFILRVHVKDFLYRFRRDAVALTAFKADAAPHNDNLLAVFIARADNIIVDRL